MKMEDLSKKVLLIKNLSSSLSNKEKTDLLKCFGAKEVRILPKKGKVKHCAFATFSSSQEATNSLNRLHQLDVLGSVLVAQYARNNLEHQKISQDLSDDDTEAEIKSQTNVSVKESCRCYQKLPNINSEFELNYSSNPKLTYLYPDPTADVLLNICAALIAVPKFYTQVLHLMNKMNLYPPFSPAKFPPPMLLDYFGKVNPLLLQTSNLHENVDRERSSETSESELDSDEPTTKNLNVLPPEKLINNLKRKNEVNVNVHKKLSNYKRRNQEDNNSLTGNIKKAKLDTTSVFEDFKSNPLKPKINVVNLSDLPEKTEHENEVHCLIESDASGFGSLAPVTEPVNISETDVNTDALLTKNFITEKELLDGKLSLKELNSLSLFKNYNPGEPSCRLYIKNLNKKVTEKDLQHIFGLFVNCNDQNELNMFDVRLMSQGRMKGQAFVGLPSIAAATRAVRLTNGFQLIGKPMIVLFARSAKPKTST